MRNDGLPNNPNISAQDMAQVHADAWRWARALLRDDPSAEDLLQQAYVMVIEGSARYDARSTLKTWLFGVIRNLALKHFRHHRREFLQLQTLASSDTSADEVHTTDHATDHATENGTQPPEQDIRALQRALLALPMRQREVLELVAYREFTLRECAHILGISVGSARTHYHRGKAQLRATLGDEA